MVRWPKWYSIGCDINGSNRPAVDTRESRSGAIEAMAATAPAAIDVPPKAKNTVVAVTTCVVTSTDHSLSQLPYTTTKQFVRN